MDDWGVSGGRRYRIGDGRSGVELDHDSIGRIAGLLAGFRDDESDQVAAEARLVTVEKGTLREPAPLRSACREGRRIPQFGGGDHVDYPGRGSSVGHVDRFDGGVREVAAHENQVAEARRAEVIDVGAGARDQSRVLTTAHPRPQAIRERHASSLREPSARLGFAGCTQPIIRSDDEMLWPSPARRCPNGAGCRSPGWL